jgi:hypothetical protein
MKMRNSLAAAIMAASTALFLAIAAPPAKADLIFTFRQVGSDVVVTGSGSWDISGTSSASVASGINGFRNNATGYISLKSGTSTPQPNIYDLTWIDTSGTTFGSTVTAPGNNPVLLNLVTGSSSSGSPFGFTVRSGTSVNNSVWLPQGYISNATITNTMTFTNTTLANFGLTVGQSGTLTASTSAGPQTISLFAVPEPTTWAMAGVAAGCAVSWSRFRRRRRSVATQV